MAARLAAAQGYSVLFFLAFALSVVMLFTDKNLQTDFGAVKQGYFLHWYVVLGTAIADLIGAIGLVVVASRTAVKAGIAGSGLMILIFLGDIATYSLVGFASATAFADYLFGVTYPGGDIRYLYDVLLAVYIVTFIVGFVILARAKRRSPAPAAAPPAVAPAT
jgi:hypothetical protein